MKFFEPTHARVIYQRGMDLSFAHVDTDHPACAFLNEAIGKPPGRLPEIQTIHAVGVDREIRQGTGELAAAPGDIRENV
ncbi:MAG: hypothetical protein C5B49_13685 [Bdellovibrio sp.]|nr:MAG: hypothetical protein C5B49_13685 [Bdellovibrio sp.]